MTRTDVIQHMQMCLGCVPFFDRNANVLAHEIGMHAKRTGDTEYAGRGAEEKLPWLTTSKYTK